MRLFVIILLAGLLSLFAGLAVTIAGSALIQCSSDPAGCGVGAAYRVFGVPVYVLAGMMVFGIAASGKDRERAVRIAMKVMVLVPLFLVGFTVISEFNSGETPRKGDMLDAVQAAAPAWAVVLTQWFVVREFIRRRAQLAPAADAPKRKLRERVSN